MADCKAKYLTAVHQFIHLVSVDAKAYMTFIKQVKEISLQYQTDLRDANIAEVRASVKHLDGRYFDQELAIKLCTVPFTVQPFTYISCTSRLRAPQGSHRMGNQWHQL